MKRMVAGWLAILGLAAFPFGAAGQGEPKKSDDPQTIVIEYRDGTRQTIRLEKKWWEILNILLPPVPAPVQSPEAKAPAAKSGETASVRKPEIPPEPVPKPVIIDVSGKWINWRQGEKKVYTMRLIQEGRRIQGLHRLSPKYVIDGTIEGNVAKGTWSSPDEVGEFIFEFSEDGRSFRGRWNTTKDLKNWKFGWNGRRE